MSLPPVDVDVIQELRLSKRYDEARELLSKYHEEKKKLMKEDKERLKNEF